MGIGEQRKVLIAEVVVLRLGVTNLLIVGSSRPRLLLNEIFQKFFEGLFFFAWLGNNRLIVT